MCRSGFGAEGHGVLGYNENDIVDAGDIESMPFIEALGQFSYRVGQSFTIAFLLFLKKPTFRKHHLHEHTQFFPCIAVSTTTSHILSGMCMYHIINMDKMT